MTLEESRKRTEASLARKRMQAGLLNGTNANVETPNPAVTSGAMDSLLEKLRAAAPQARDQRDRRRRARLKERHQVRVASDQHIPEAPEGEEGESMDANDAESNSNANNNDDDASTETGLMSPPGHDEKGGSPESHEGGDVADRAASMLQGLRDNMDDGERSRRRRESAEEERRKRRMRRRNGPTSGSKDSGDMTSSGLPSLKEPVSPPSTEDDTGSQPPSTPAIVVSSNADQQRSPDDSNGKSTDDGDADGDGDGPGLPPNKRDSESD